MDRGIPTEVVPEEMRSSDREIFHLVRTPRSKIRRYEKKRLDLPWRKVPEAVEVKLFGRGGGTLCAGQKGRAAGERDNHAAEEAGSVVTQVASYSFLWPSILFSRAVRRSRGYFFRPLAQGSLLKLQCHIESPAGRLRAFRRCSRDNHRIQRNCRGRLSCSAVCVSVSGARGGSTVSGTS
jgi:hypothetical protein